MTSLPRIIIASLAILQPLRPISKSFLVSNPIHLIDGQTAGRLSYASECPHIDVNVVTGFYTYAEQIHNRLYVFIFISKEK